MDLGLLPATRANAYNLVPALEVPRAPSAPCPVRGAPPGDEGGRSLFVRLRDRMVLARTTTADFTDAELRAVKDGSGQLYADVSRKLAPDDFARDLRKLRPSEECAACVDRAACPRSFEATRQDLFTRDDAMLGAMLGELTGRVLDLGAGEGAHLAPLAARAHAIAYTAVEPDAGRAALLRARFPWARFVVGVAEDLDVTLGPFDHVLFVRSYNHLTDPARAVARALACLAPGGTLILVDNVAFGLVRTARRARDAESAPGNLREHYRNDDAAAALAVVDRAASSAGRTLALIERRDVGPETSNQWILRLR